jgi:SAM-dependent methyltransferase
LLLAITNHLTQNIAAIPFLWILPLSLYLLSLILCFESGRWYRRWLFVPLAAASLPVTARFLSGDERISAIALLSTATFVLFMVCHGELARRRPIPAQLTSFYLMIAAGGALGGLFIALAAPYLFNALYDLPIVLSLTALLLLYLLWIARALKVTLFTLVAGITFGFIGILAHKTWNSFGYSRLLVRNFYGSLVVYDNTMPRAMGPVRVLRNGMIAHGEQFLWQQNRRYPTTYYAHDSGIGRALTALMQQGPVNVGVIGLGAGTLAAYARPIDRYSFYEINPKVVRIATTQFTFLKDCPAPHAVIPGDARLSLEREPPKQFDILAVDAFSGDSIPVHLLTREAFELYWRHLKPNGVLAVHVSNKYLSLAPVVALAALENRKLAMMLPYDGNETNEESSSDWVLITSRHGFFKLPAIAPVAELIDLIPGLRPWTDNYSNLYRILQ